MRWRTRDMVAALDKVRNHFGVNRIAQAGARASLGDDEFVREVVRQVEEGRREIRAAINGIGTENGAFGDQFRGTRRGQW